MAARETLDLLIRTRGARSAKGDLRGVGRETSRLGNRQAKAGRQAARAARGQRALGRATALGNRHMRRGIGAAVGLAGAYIGLAKAKEAVSTTMDLAKGTMGLSKATGLATREASRWVNVTRVRGVESKALMMSFGTLSKNMDAATEKGSTQADMFERLGVSHRQLAKGDMADVLGQMSTGFAELGDTPARTAVGMKLMGRGWQSVLPIMRDGEGAMRDILGTSDEMGATLSKEQVEKTMELVSAQRKLKLASLGLKATFATALMPELIAGAKSLERMAKILGDDDLTGAEKIDKLGDVAAKRMTIWGDALEKANFASKMGDMFAEALPVMAEAAGRGGGIAVRSFIKGWWHTNLGGKLFVLGLLGARLGVFRGLASLASNHFSRRFAARTAAQMGESMAPTGAIGTGVVGGTGKASRWGRLATGAGRVFGPIFAAVIVAEIWKHRGDIENVLGDIANDFWGLFGGDQLESDTHDPTGGEGQRKADERARGGVSVPDPRPNQPSWHWGANPPKLVDPRKVKRAGSSSVAPPTANAGRAAMRRQRGARHDSRPLELAQVSADIPVQVPVYLDGKRVGTAVGKARADFEARR